MIFSDQLGNTLTLNAYPKRIISLVPSQSELLWDLGLQNQLVGITKFCIHPKDMYKSIIRVGGTKTLQLDVIKKLQPDLIIGNKEENEQVQIEHLRSEFNLWMSDIYTLDDSLAMIRTIGAITNTTEKANDISQTIETNFTKLQKTQKKVLYLIWNKPYMAAGRYTFIGNLLTKMGLENVLKDPQGRYPEISIEEIKILRPELVLLSSEPYPFSEKHIEAFKHELSESNIMLVDGELFSWYGSRLLKSVSYFNELDL